MIGCAPEHCLPLIICSALRNIFMFPRISYWEERMTIRRMNRLTYNKIISINTLHPQVPSECINYKKRPIAQYDGSFLVEVTGLEPTTSWSLTKRATKLRYTSMKSISYYINYWICVKRFSLAWTKNFFRIKIQPRGRG